MKEKYYINKDKKVVVYKVRHNSFLTDMETIFDKDCRDVIQDLDLSTFFAYDITGIARCSGDDEFDEQTGMDIAKLKADMKKHYYLSKKSNQICKKLESMIRKLTDYGTRHSKKYYSLKNLYENKYINNKNK